MAGTAIRLSALILKDGWPGPVNFNLGIPANGWDNTQDNFKTTAAQEPPAYPLGTKIPAYTDNTNCPGWYTMMYLAFHDFSSQDIAEGDITAAKGWCAHANGVECGTRTSGIIANDVSIVPYYVVARCTTAITDATEGGPICLPCASMSADSSIELVSGSCRDLSYGHAYGWFWVGGVCPCKDATFMDASAGGTKGADVSVNPLTRAGDIMACISSDGVCFVTSDVSEMIDATSIIGRGYISQAWSCMSEGI